MCIERCVGDTSAIRRPYVGHTSCRMRSCCPCFSPFAWLRFTLNAIRGFLHLAVDGGLPSVLAGEGMRAREGSKPSRCRVGIGTLLAMRAIALIRKQTI